MLATNENFLLARSKSTATTLLLLPPAAVSNQTVIMVEPSVSFMSAFLPKASLLLGLSFAGFYSQQYLKVLGGNLPVRDQMSFRPEHKEAERRRFLNMVRLPHDRLCNLQQCAVHVVSSKCLVLQEREAAPDDPVIMNPFR